MRVVVVATGDIALPTWDWLLQSELEVVALVTQPDKPAGRRMEMTPPTIKLRALAAGVLVLQPDSLRKKSAIDAVVDLKPDLIVVMAYGQILTQRFLAIPPLACVNLHASLLPKWRGASCIQAAIDHGDTESGISVMHIVRDLDAGDVILQKTLPITGNTTGGSLHDALANLAPVALAEAIELLRSSHAPRLPQDEKAVSYVGKLLREHGRLDWRESSHAIERRIRAYDPWPGTYTVTASGMRVKIFPPTRVIDELEIEPGCGLCRDSEWLIGCGRGALALSDVQAEGGKRISAMDFARGQRDGVRFVSAD